MKYFITLLAISLALTPAISRADGESKLFKFGRAVARGAVGGVGGAAVGCAIGAPFGVLVIGTVLPNVGQSALIRVGCAAGIGMGAVAGAAVMGSADAAPSEAQLQAIDSGEAVEGPDLALEGQLAQE